MRNSFRQLTGFRYSHLVYIFKISISNEQYFVVGAFTMPKKNLKVIKKSVLNNNTVIPFEILRKEDDIIGLSTYSIAISTGLVFN